MWFAVERELKMDYIEPLCIIGGEIVIYVLAVIGYRAWEVRRKQAHVTAVHADWLSHKRAVDVRPVQADYFGSEPEQSHGIRAHSGSGALGLTDRHLVFIGRGKRGEVWIPFDQIRWIGTRYIATQRGRSTISREALIVHYEAKGVRHVGAWIPFDSREFADALSEVTGLPVEHRLYEREDLGPVEAVVLSASDHDTLTEGRRLDLYLTPDSLVFGRRDPIQLSQVRRVAYAEEFEDHLNPGKQGLLRIEYETCDHGRQIATILVENVQAWGAAIAQRALVPLERYSAHAAAFEYWSRPGHTMHFGPVRTLYRGDRPCEVFTHREAGALGIVDDRLIFTREDGAAEINVPLEIIRWIGLQPIEVNAVQEPIHQLAMFVHSEVESDWRVWVFSPENVDGLPDALQKAGGVAFDTQHTDRRLDHGPAEVSHWQQDIYGRWSKVGEVKLYLAPDRLVFTGHEAIHLAQVRQLAVVRRHRPHVGQPALLRVDWLGPDGKLHTDGFGLSPRESDAWAEVLHWRTDVPVEHYTGQRKKKA
jgi:hypothetical protein